MRFFLMACTFCLLIASLGCMTNNWSSPLFKNSPLLSDAPPSYEDGDYADEPMESDDEKPRPGFWKSKFGESSGVDPRAQAIEKRFGL